MTDSEIRRAIDREHTRLNELVSVQAKKIAALEGERDAAREQADHWQGEVMRLLEHMHRHGPTPDAKPDAERRAIAVDPGQGRDHSVVTLYYRRYATDAAWRRARALASAVEDVTNIGIRLIGCDDGPPIETVRAGLEAILDVARSPIKAAASALLGGGCSSPACQMCGRG